MLCCEEESLDARERETFQLELSKMGAKMRSHVTHMWKDEGASG